jgi:NADH:ubiquinone oxidoreductase subunit 2 (subunit N)
VLGIAAILSSVIGAYIYLRLILLIFSKQTPAEKISLDWKLALVLITSLILLFAGWMLIL